VRDSDAAKRVCAGAVESFGRIDILVNCAAGNFLATAENLTPKGFKTVMDIDTIGTFTMSSAAFPYLKAAAASTPTPTVGASSLIVNISAMLQYPATHW
jgi:peroxisomal 2,4-dienoyl-CoA reductase